MTISINTSLQLRLLSKLNVKQFALIKQKLGTSFNPNTYELI